MARSPFSTITQAPSQRTSVGQTRPQLSPRMFASRMTRAAPRTFPVMTRLMKPGTSIRVGQAMVHGASKQYRHRKASIAACRAFIGGVMSAKFFSYSSGVSFGAVSRRDIHAPLVPGNEQPGGIIFHRAPDRISRIILALRGSQLA